MLKTVLISLSLALLPLTAVAQSCEHETRTCAEGQQWDTDTAKCVPIVSS